MSDGEPFVTAVPTLGILLISGGEERAHYAFVLATAAAAIGRDVTLFATNAGCHALLAKPPFDGPHVPGVASLAELREAAGALGIRLLACPAGLRLAGLETAELAPGVTVAGVPAFLVAAPGQVITL